MNKIMEKQYPIYKLYQQMRMHIFDAINDVDLAFSPPHCPTLGELCVQIGEWQRSYIDSFKTFKQNFDYRQPDQGMSGSTPKLKAWFEAMDAELLEALEALSDEDIDSKVVDKGDWEASLTWNLDIYKECIIIFFTKAWVYLKIMGKPLPKGWDHWIS